MPRSPISGEYHSSPDPHPHTWWQAIMLFVVFMAATIGIGQCVANDHTGQSLCSTMPSGYTVCDP